MNTTLDVPQYPFTFTEIDRVIRFLVRDELVLGNRQAFKQQIVDLIAQDRHDVVLDCARCSYIDSSGLGALVSVAKKLREAGGQLRLEHLNADVREQFRHTQLDTLFTIVEDRAA